MKRWAMALTVIGPLSSPATAQATTDAAPAGDLAALTPRIDAIFDEWVRTRHVPGAVYGIVTDGRLVHVRALGTQDQVDRRPITADSRFRIASMSKAFTALAILKLRDAGKLSLEAPAETYVPEVNGWASATSEPLPERDFSAMQQAGVPFANAPA